MVFGGGTTIHYYQTRFGRREPDMERCARFKSKRVEGWLSTVLFG